MNMLMVDHDGAEKGVAPHTGATAASSGGMSEQNNCQSYSGVRGVGDAPQFQWIVESEVFIS